MDFWEEIIQYYFTADKKFAVLSQAAVTKDIHGKAWLADIDFMALDFIEKKIYLTEVNSSADYQKTIRVTNRLEKDNCTNIESYIRKTSLIMSFHPSISFGRFL